MTSKEYYKQTSDMAFTVNEIHFHDNTVEGNVALLGGSPEDAKKILEENDFFGITEWDKSIDTDYVKFRLTFVYSSSQYEVYNLNVCDVIDCRIGGGNVVFSCDGYELVDSEGFDVEETADRVGNIDTVEDDDFGFPFFGFGFGKQFRKMEEEMEKMFEDAVKGNFPKNGTFTSTVYSKDADGNVNYRKVTNDKVIERSFNVNDKDAPKSIEEIEKSTPVKEVIEDKTSTPKSDLKDLLKG